MLYCCLSCKTFFLIIIFKNGPHHCPVCYSPSYRIVYNVSINGGEIGAFTLDTRKELPITYYSESCIQRNNKFISVWDRGFFPS